MLSLLRSRPRSKWASRPSWSSRGDVLGAGPDQVVLRARAELDHHRLEVVEVDLVDLDPVLLREPLLEVGVHVLGPVVDQQVAVDLRLDDPALGRAVDRALDRAARRARSRPAPGRRRPAAARAAREPGSCDRDPRRRSAGRRRATLGDLDRCSASPPGDGRREPTEPASRRELERRALGLGRRSPRRLALGDDRGDLGPPTSSEDPAVVVDADRALDQRREPGSRESRAPRPRRRGRRGRRVRRSSAPRRAGRRASRTNRGRPARWSPRAQRRRRSGRGEAALGDHRRGRCEQLRLADVIDLRARAHPGVLPPLKSRAVNPEPLFRKIHRREAQTSPGRPGCGAAARIMGRRT